MTLKPPAARGPSSDKPALGCCASEQSWSLDSLMPLYPGSCWGVSICHFNCWPSCSPRRRSRQGSEAGQYGSWHTLLNEEQMRLYMPIFSRAAHSLCQNYGVSQTLGHRNSDLLSRFHQIRMKLKLKKNQNNKLKCILNSFQQWICFVFVCAYVCGVKLTIHLQLVWGQENMDLYIHSSIRLHGVVLN
jgi:hypothetical protein